MLDDDFQVQVTRARMNMEGIDDSDDPFLSGPDTSVIGRDWRTWYTAIFGEQFVSVLASHHIEAIQWHWDSRMAQLKGVRPEYLAYFPIWPRGHMKSTIARRIAVCDAAITKTGYCLYGSGTKKKVKGHAVSIEALLRSDAVKRWYPLLSTVKKNEQGNSKGWTADFLNTEQGYVFHFVGLDEGVAGANIEDVRPSLIIPDDIDDREDSPVISASRLHVFTRSYLPTRQAGTLVFFPQNLIAEHTVMNQIYSGQERVLTNRKPTHPIPAILNLVTETREKDGIVRDVIMAGEPTWKFYDMDRAQEEVDTIGLDSFEAECQHNIELHKGGLIMASFDEDVHLITVSQFRQKFGSNLFPLHWEQRHSHDVGYTGADAHPGVFFSLGVAAANSPMPGRLFIAPEIFLGTKKESPDHAAERYLERVLDGAPGSDGRLRLTTDPTDPTKRWTEEQIALAAQLYAEYRAERPNLICRMSHEALGTRRVFEKYGMHFRECNPGADGGVQQLQHYHKIDYSKAHEFHPGRMGVSNIYWVVADDQIEKARDEMGMARGRLEAKRWRWRKVKLTETGLTVMKPMKAWDDFFNAAMMATHDMAMTIIPLNKDEKIEAAIPDNLKWEQIESGRKELTPGFEMARAHALARVTQEIEQQDESEFERMWKGTVTLIGFLFLGLFQFLG